jgi:NAD(P)-dependent dehydrogenase (short-subunit alcohol dehydrogenase family)
VDWVPQSLCYSLGKVRTSPSDTVGDRDRAQRLSASIERNFGRQLALVEGHLCDAVVRRRYLEAARTCGPSIAGAAIFAGHPARVPLGDLDREASVDSLESNYVGPVLLARDLGEAMENGEGGGIVSSPACRRSPRFLPASTMRAPRPRARERRCAWSNGYRNGSCEPSVRQV